MLLQSWQQQLHVAPMPAATTCLVQTGTQQAAPGEHLVQCSAHVVESIRGTGSRHAQRLTWCTLLHTTRHRNQGRRGCTGHWQQVWRKLLHRPFVYSSMCHTRSACQLLPLTVPANHPPSRPQQHALLPHAVGAISCKPTPR